MKTSLIFIVGCLLGVYNSGSNAGIIEEIYNGETASKGQFPYDVYVRVHHDDGSTASCTGSLISDMWVITAGHCARGIAFAELFFGVVDRNDPDATQVTVQKENIYQHPNYSRGPTRNDLTLMKLPSAMEMSDTIGTIGLPQKSQAPVNTFVGQMATASGWGKTRSSQHGAYRTLQFATIRVTSNSICKRRFSGVDDGNICTDKKINKGPCPGDSGGPLAINGTDGKPVLIGTVSYGSSDCEDRVPVVYANVPYYLDWISDTSGIAVQ